jgi:phosphate starvation-inducible PhoH-like protein
MEKRGSKKESFLSKKKHETNLQIEFDDNAMLPLLFGEHNINLIRVENKLDVILDTRGNKLLISGSKEKVSDASKAMNDLYAQVKTGQEIVTADVDGVLRMLSSKGNDKGIEDINNASVKTKKRQIRPRSSRQAAYLNSINDNDLVFGLGPAGTGKTYLAVAKGVEALITGKVDRIVLSRPAVEAGEQLGFLPGDMREKVDPYLRPLYDALFDMLPENLVAKKLDSGEIEIAPLAFMRGRTLSDAFVILDEAQNTTPVQMKMFLTRLGENASMVITGDLSQVDLPLGTRSGLLDAAETLNGVKGISFIHFTELDVVRHSLVSRIIQAYKKNISGNQYISPRT